MKLADKFLKMIGEQEGTIEPKAGLPQDEPQDVQTEDILTTEEAEELADEIRQAFETKLSEFGITGINVVSAVDTTGKATLVFVDSDGNVETVEFGTEDNNAYAVVGSNGSEDTYVDITLVEPTRDERGNIDLVNLDWLNKSTLEAIVAPLTLNSVEVETEPPVEQEPAEDDEIEGEEDEEEQEKEKKQPLEVKVLFNPSEFKEAKIKVFVKKGLASGSLGEAKSWKLKVPVLFKWSEGKISKKIKASISKVQAFYKIAEYCLKWRK